MNGNMSWVGLSLSAGGTGVLSHVVVVMLRNWRT